MEEGLKIEWGVAERDVGFLGNEDGAEARSVVGTQFGCYCIGCTWVVFIDSSGWCL